MKIITKYLSTALIALLLVLLVCLCFVYMNSYNNVESSEFTREMDVAVREKSYKSGYVGLLDDTLVSPYFFGYSVGGDKFGYFGQGAGDCYSSFSGVISALFGPESTVSVASETDFYKCFSGDFVYIKYRSELPKSVIYYAQNPDGILEEISDEYVYEMVVSVNNPAFALTRDRMGNCYIYRASQNFLYNKNLLYSYNKFEGGFAFDFAADSEIDASYASLGFYEKINDTAVIRNNSFSAASAVVQPLKTDDGFVLAKFGMNPEKVTS
ncbi:MAG: hypothetical protein KBS59_05620, partial [Clostridiales bacterium]|nr:hypothetical protein [Clostridiales bacterium]